MTLIGKVQVPDDRWIYMWYLINPASGAHNVVVSASGTSLIGGMAVSYTGAKQSAQPDAFATNSSSGATSITTSVTTVANNCWTVLYSKIDGTAITAGTGSTQRVNNTGKALFDSNSALTPAGSKSMTLTDAASPHWGVVMASFSPF